VGVQKQHDLAHDFLLGQGGHDALANTFHFPQPPWCRLDDLKNLIAEGVDEALGVDRAESYRYLVWGFFCQGLNLAPPAFCLFFQHRQRAFFRPSIPPKRPASPARSGIKVQVFDCFFKAL
jgi:hypothetical protein